MPKENTANRALERPDQNLPMLFGRLTDDLTELFDVKLQLLKTELKEEITSYAGGVSLIVGGAVIGLIGCVVLSVGIAFFVSMLFDSTALSSAIRYGLGFVITALLYLVTGAITILVAKRRLAKQRIIPERSAREFKRDKQWLQGKA
jgi:Putative Actinobacterial Holin-X, holin superfamily III